MTTNVLHEETGTVTIHQPETTVTVTKQRNPIVNEDGGTVRVEQPVINITTIQDENIITLTRDVTQIIEVTRQGIRGAMGPPGPGAEETDIIVTVGTGGVNSFQLVYIDDNDTVRAANALNPSHYGRIIGFVLSGGNPGDEVVLKTGGKLENPLWNLTPGAVYFAGEGGEITTNIPATGFYMKIGRALNSTTLIIDLGESILINNN